MAMPPSAPEGAVQECNALNDDRYLERAALWYPDCLREAEHEALKQRPEAAQTGLAFSGGGVRSATFCLGIMQGLSKVSRARSDKRAVAADPLLARFGFLSTVSGGGYFGGFLTQLFQRRPIRDAADVEAVLADDVSATSANAAGVDAPTSAYGHYVMHWLRENGRYLAPSGSGDYLLALATVVRNWLSLQMVYATLALIFLLGMQLLRWSLYFLLPGREVEEVWRPRLMWPPVDSDLLAFSPYYFLVFAMVAFAFTPVAAA
jgi:hypothetical protein